MIFYSILKELGLSCTSATHSKKDSFITRNPPKDEEQPY
jgi:hypothetical protein